MRQLRRKPDLPKRSLRWWTKQEVETLLELRQARLTWRAIGRFLKREPSAVRDKWFRVMQKMKGNPDVQG